MHTNRKGVTLVELMIVLVILLFVLSVVYGIFITQKRTQTAEEMLVDLSQEARGGLQSMVRELRMVGAMTNVPAAAPYMVPCRGEDLLTGPEFIIIEAGPDYVEFEGDTDLKTGDCDSNGDGQIGSGERCIERIRYSFDSSKGILYRRERKISANNPPVTTRANGSNLACNVSISSDSAQAVAYNIKALSFKYYDEKNNPVTTAVAAAAADSASVTIKKSIRKIAISITAEGAKYKPGTSTKPLRTLSVEVMLQNMKVGVSGADTTPPAAPSGVTAVNREVCGFLGVTWTANGEGDLAGYKVHYKQQRYDVGTGQWEWPASGWDGIQTVGLITSYIFTGLSNGAAAKVAVLAFDSSGNQSALSTESQVTLSDTHNPNVITGLAGVANSTTGQIALTWSQGADTDRDAQTSNSGTPYRVDYYLYRDTSASGSFTTLATSITNSITTTSFTDTVPDKCVTYYYKMKAVDSCNRESMTSAVGSSGTTMIIVNSISPPQTFYPGGGPTKETQGNTKYNYARFSGQIVNDPLVNLLVIEQKNASTCPNPPTAKGEAGWTELPGSRNLNLDPANPIPMNQSFTGDWDGITQTKVSGTWQPANQYRFIGYSKNKCGYYSDPKDPGYCVTKCDDSPSYSGNTGLGDACIRNLTDPITGLVCDRITTYWVTKPTPAACTAYGTAATNDFYPDEGDGGYIVNRATYDAITGTYRRLAPDPVTGPIQPFYYIDAFYMGATPDCPTIDSTNCDYVTADNVACYRDRCSYRYKVHAVDCTALQANYSAAYAEQNVASRTDLTHPAFSPGIINSPSDAATYPVEVRGTKKNKVLFYIQNTAAAIVTWKKAIFDWIDTAAKLVKVEICNSEPGTPSTSCGSWDTMWEASGNSTGVSNATLIDFGASSYIDHAGATRTPASHETADIAASALLGSGNPVRAHMRLTFNDTGGLGRRMDDGNELITISPGWENVSSTVTDKTCGPSSTTSFSVRPQQGPVVESVTQQPPNFSGTVAGDPAISNTPPSGNFRSYAYNSANLGRYFVDNTGVTVRARITPWFGYPVAQCGDTGTYRGVILYYAVTDNTVTSAPIPLNASDELEILKPTKTNLSGITYQKQRMCNETGATPCSAGTCSYVTDTPIPAMPQAGYDGKRVWYYINGIDSYGNFNSVPAQPTDSFTTTYNYDAKQKRFYYIWISGVSFSSDRLSITNVWTNRIKGASGSDPSDTATAGTTSTIIIKGKQLADPLQEQTETITRTTVSGCADCWASETGFASSVTTVNAFAEPATYPITIEITNHKDGFEMDKTCKWQYNGTTLSLVTGIAAECKQ